MARDWNEPDTLSALEAKLVSIAPENTAPIPLTLTRQRNEITDEWMWVVDVHVRIPRVTEYEVSAADTTLPGALRRAYLGLNSHRRLRRQADSANLVFGVSV